MISRLITLLLVILPISFNFYRCMLSHRTCVRKIFVSACSKIFESVLLRMFDYYISTHDNQFGFKKRHSTDMCIYALICTIEYYRLHNSPVYSCYLGASKAFAKVNHCNLFKKLINRNVTLLVVRILMFWYRNQTFIVKGGSLSPSTFQYVTVSAKAALFLLIYLHCMSMG